MQDIDVKRKTIIPCNNSEILSCGNRILLRGVTPALWCHAWRENRAKDKIICACDPGFNCKGSGE